jgi:hypothetical protein
MKKSLLVLSATLMCGFAIGAQAQNVDYYSGPNPLVPVSAPPLVVPALVTPPLNCPSLVTPPLVISSRDQVDDRHDRDNRDGRHDHNRAGDDQRRWDVDYRADDNQNDNGRRDDHRAGDQQHRNGQSANAGNPNNRSTSGSGSQDHTGSNFNPSGTTTVTVTPNPNPSITNAVTTPAVPAVTTAVALRK